MVFKMSFRSYTAIAQQVSCRYYLFYIHYFAPNGNTITENTER